MSRSEEFTAGHDVGHLLSGVKAYLHDEPPATSLPTLYHGTAHDFSYGLVMPSTALAHRSKWKEFYDNPDERWRQDRVFASQHENSAWHWAQGPGRLRVHEVSMHDPRLVPMGHGEFHGEHAMVKGTHWAPPPAAGSWNQPSISPIDWRPYGGRHWEGDEHRQIDRDIAAEKAPPANLHPAQFEGQGRLFDPGPATGQRPKGTPDQYQSLGINVMHVGEEKPARVSRRPADRRPLISPELRRKLQEQGV